MSTDDRLYHVQVISPRGYVVLDVTGKRASVLQLLVGIALDNTPERALFPVDDGQTTFQIRVVGTRSA